MPETPTAAGELRMMAAYCERDRDMQRGFFDDLNRFGWRRWARYRLGLSVGYGSVAVWLRARADELDPPAGQED